MTEEELKTNFAIKLFDYKNKIATEEEFENEIKKRMESAKRNGIANTLYEVKQNAIKKIR